MEDLVVLKFLDPMTQQGYGREGPLLPSPMNDRRMSGGRGGRGGGGGGRGRGRGGSGGGSGGGRGRGGSGGFGGGR